MQPMRVLLSLLALTMLVGCFVSQTDFITSATADYPIAADARFAVYSLNEDGKRKQEEPEHVTVSRDGADYVLSKTGETPIRGLMDEIGKDDYVLMIRDEEHAGQTLYILLHRYKDAWLRYGVDCANFEDLVKAQGKSLADFHTANDGGNCSFSSYDDIKAALSFVQAHRAPDGEYMPE